MMRLFRLSTGNVWGGSEPLRVWTVYLRWPIKINFWSSDDEKETA